MIKKRKNLFIKLGCLFGAITLAFTFVMVKPKAYTYQNNVFYSDNAINFVNPELVIASNEYNFNNMVYYDEMSYMFNYNDGYSFSAFQVSLYSNNRDSDFITTLYTSSSISAVYNAISIPQFNGQTISYLQANYSNYRIRFLVRSFNGQVYEYSYLQFNCGDMFNYWANFKDLNIANNYYVVTCAWDAQHVGQDRTWCYVFSQLGFYAQNSPTHSNYDYYGVNGIYRNQWNDSLFESYQTYITNLQEQNAALRKQIQQLNEQLSEPLGWKPLFFAMADTPFRVVKSFLGFEVLGVDLFGAFIGFLTILAILWIIKKILR